MTICIIVRPIGKANRPKTDLCLALHFFGNDDPQNQVQQQAGSAEDKSQHEDQPDQRRIDTKVLSQAATYAAQPAIGLAARQSLFHSEPPVPVNRARERSAIASRLSPDDAHYA